MNTKTKITISLDEQVLERLRAAAREDTRSVSGFIEVLAKTAFRRSGQTAPNTDAAAQNLALPEWKEGA